MSDYTEAETLHAEIDRLLRSRRLLKRNSGRYRKDRPRPRAPLVPPARSATRSVAWKWNCGQSGVIDPSNKR